MGDTFFKDLIGFKLRIFDSIIDKLPDPAGKKAKDLEMGILTAIYEVVGDYTTEASKKKEDKSVKSISIE